MPRDLTPRGKARRAQLLACAARLFAERGYHPTSISHIVDDLGVGKGVFYWYFASKEELLTELLKAAHQDLRRRQQAAIAGETDPVRRVDLGIRASIEWFRDHRDYFAITQFAATDETFAPVLRAMREAALHDTAHAVTDAIAAGHGADQDPLFVAHAIHGVVEALTRRFLVEADEPLDSVSDLAVAFCLHGLRGVGESELSPAW